MNTVSVIIPTYNRSQTLSNAIDSVLAQQSKALEVVVVDDGSTDETQDLLGKYEGKIKVITQSNQGVSAARNAGINAALGEWIALLDSDDIWHKDKLSRQLETIEQNPTARLVHCDEIWIRQGARVNPMQKHKKFDGYIFKQCLPLCCISPSATLIKKDVFEEIGLFDTELPACEDYDLWLRYCYKYPVHFIDEQLLTKYGGHDDQLSAKYFGMDRFRIRALEKLAQNTPLSYEQLTMVIAMAVKKINIYCKGAAKRNKVDEIERYQQLKAWFESLRPTK